MTITLIGSKSMANASGNGGNPYLSVADLDPVASILAGNVSSDQAVKQLRALGVTYPYTAVVPQFAAGPFIQITVTGKVPALVSQQLPIVTRYTEQRLTQLQQETAIPTPPKATLTTQEIVPPSTPTKVLKTKLEVVAGVFVLMFVGTLIVIAVVDNVRRRRSGKRRVAPEQESATPERSPAVPLTRWPGRRPPTGTPRTHRRPRECDERRDDDLQPRGGGIPAARPGAGRRSR